MQGKFLNPYPFGQAACERCKKVMCGGPLTLSVYEATQTQRIPQKYKKKQWGIVPPDPVLVRYVQSSCTSMDFVSASAISSSFTAP